ncbi:MAG: DUF1573 domain-containing protein [Bacteroidota bacterium]
MRFKPAALLALVLSLGLMACQSGNQDVRDAAAARQDLTPASDAITANPPANGTVQPTPPAPNVAVNNGPTTSIAFAEEEFNFGTVDEGEVVTKTYNFTNTGENPLIISDARGSCGCTVPSKPTAPIMPGEDGEITVQFNSQGKRGDRNQKVTITANTNPPQTFIYLKGTVTPSADAPANVTTTTVQ